VPTLSLERGPQAVSASASRRRSPAPTRAAPTPGGAPDTKVIANGGVDRFAALEDDRRGSRGMPSAPSEPDTSSITATPRQSAEPSAVREERRDEVKATRTMAKVIG
jgi:hypothetical protein